VCASKETTAGQAPAILRNVPPGVDQAGRASAHASSIHVLRRGPRLSGAYPTATRMSGPTGGPLQLQKVAEAIQLAAADPADRLDQASVRPHVDRVSGDPEPLSRFGDSKRLFVLTETFYGATATEDIEGIFSFGSGEAGHGVHPPWHDTAFSGQPSSGTPQVFHLMLRTSSSGHARFINWRNVHPGSHIVDVVKEIASQAKPLYAG